MWHQPSMDSGEEPSEEGDYSNLVLTDMLEKKQLKFMEPALALSGACYSSPMRRGSCSCPSSSPAPRGRTKRRTSSGRWCSSSGALR